MRVMLVYSNRARIMEPAPPIGLSYVATATRQAGHEVKFVDLMVSREPLADLKKAIREFQPEVVGFSVRNIDNIIAQRVSWQLHEVGAMIDEVRKHSEASIGPGGRAASILGATALKRLGADFVIVGEGEVAFPELLSAISGSRDYGSINGLCYQENGNIFSVAPVRRGEFGGSGMENWINWRPVRKGRWHLGDSHQARLSALLPLLQLSGHGGSRTAQSHAGGYRG